MVLALVDGGVRAPHVWCGSGSSHGSHSSSSGCWISRRPATCLVVLTAHPSALPPCGHLVCAHGCCVCVCVCVCLCVRACVCWSFLCALRCSVVMVVAARQLINGAYENETLQTRFNDMRHAFNTTDDAHSQMMVRWLSVSCQQRKRRGQPRGSGGRKGGGREGGRGAREGVSEGTGGGREGREWTGRDGEGGCEGVSSCHPGRCPSLASLHH